MQKISSEADGGGTYNESEAVAAAIGAVGNAELEGEVESVVNELHVTVPHRMCRLLFLSRQVEEAVGGGYLTDAEFTKLVRPEKMIGPK